MKKVINGLTRGGPYKLYDQPAQQHVSTGIIVVWLLRDNCFLLGLWLIPQEVIHVWSYKSNQNPMSVKVIDPRGKSTIVVLLNGCIVKLPSSHLFIATD